MLVFASLGAPAFASGASSADHRQDLTASLGIAPATFVLMPDTFTLGTSVYASYYLTPDIALDGQAAATVSGGGRYSMEYEDIGIKWFLGNSLYARAGAARRHVTDDLYYSKIDDSCSGSEVDCSGYGGPKTLLDNSTFGGSASVGNQWQWRRFAINVQWLSVYIPAAQAYVNRSEARVWTTRSTFFLPERFLGFSF